jgi:hypothetical protein
MKNTKNHRIMITLPASVLKDVNWLAPLEDMTRDELILVAIKQFLKPHLEIRKQVLKAASQKGKTYGPFETIAEMRKSLEHKIRKRRSVTKAIAESTKDFKTGRYEEPED